MTSYSSLTFTLSAFRKRGSKVPPIEHREMTLPLSFIWMKIDVIVPNLGLAEIKKIANKKGTKRKDTSPQRVPNSIAFIAHKVEAQYASVRACWPE